jgi:hypothetical protein
VNQFVSQLKSLLVKTDSKPGDTKGIGFQQLFGFFFCVVLLFYAVGFYFGVAEFAKSGLPLPFTVGQQGGIGIQPKLFVFEILFLISALFCLLIPSARAAILANVRHPTELLWLFFVLIGLFICWLPFDLPKNPVLAIRNSAFVWYLFFPIMILCLPVSVELLSRVAWIILGYCALYFLYSVYCSWFVIPSTGIGWSPEIGVGGLLAFALVTPRKKLGYFLLFSIGAGIGISFWIQVQRTALVGLGLIFFGAILFTYLKPRRALQSLGFIMAGALLAGVSFPILPPCEGKATYTFMGCLYRDNVALVSQDSNNALGGLVSKQVFLTLNKSEPGPYGLERFRMDMWKDALGLFLQRPFTGIGFVRPVVYRAFLSQDIYAPNTTGYEPNSTAPIAGPHNSYLNSLTRLGIGGLLLLLIHVFAGLILWRQKQFALFYLMFGQAVYACFNVGLEGPIRSFLILIALGAALKLSRNVSLRQILARV